MVILLAGLSLRLLFVLSLPPDRCIDPVQDQKIYRLLGKQLSEGKGLICPPMEPVSIDALPGDAANRRMIVQTAVQDGYFRGVVKVGQPTAFWEPLYPLLLGLSITAIGEHLLVIRLVQVLLSASNILLVFYLSRLMFPSPSRRRIWLLSSLLVALYPFFIYYCGLLMTETLYMTCLLTVVVFVFRYDISPTASNAVMIGLLCGGTYLARSVIIGLVPLILFFLVLRHRFSVRGWYHAGLTVLVFSLMLSPWVVRNYQQFGEPVLSPTKGGPTFWARNNPLFLEQDLAGSFLFPAGVERWRQEPLLQFPSFAEETEIERGRELFRRMFRFIVQEPGTYLKLCVKKAGWFLSPFGGPETPWWQIVVSLVSYGATFLFAIGGLLFQGARSRSQLMLWGVIAYFVVFHSLINGDTRFRIPVDLFFLVLAAPVMDRMISCILEKPTRPKAGR